MEYLHYILIGFILLVIAISIVKAKKKDFKIKINKLIEALGGKNNIINYEYNKSRFIVNLKDVELVNKVTIQKLGAKGIVEIENQLKIILGEDAYQLKKYIDELKWFITFFIMCYNWNRWRKWE